MPTYRNILKKSISLTLKNKKLWVFGFFTALLGNGGEYNIIISNIKSAFNAAFDLSKISNPLSIIYSIFYSILNIIKSNNIIQNFALMLAIIGLIYLAIISQGSLIYSIYDNATKKHKTNIKNNLIKIRGKFWELFFVNLLFKLLGATLAIAVAFPISALISTSTIIEFKYSIIISSILFFIPIIIIASFLSKYTILFIVAKNRYPLESITKSVKLFKENWLITIENALLLFALNILFGIISLIIAIIISFVPIAMLAVIIYPMALPEGYYISIIAWVSILFVIPILGSILSVFQYASWTILFAKLNSKKKVHSKIARITASFLEKIL